MRWLVVCLALLPFPAFSQDKAQTLADLQAELARLSADFNGLKAELIESAERSQAGRGESRLGHVEVFRMVSVGTSILGGPRPLSSHRPANPDYTLNCEEPN